MAEIEVKRGMPVPRKRSASIKYPIYTMEIGEYFLVSPDKIASCRSAIAKFRRGEGFYHEFDTRRIDQSAYGVWRTK